MKQTRQAAALIDSFRQFTMPLDLEVLVDLLRADDDNARDHMLADVIEAQRDMIRGLQFRLATEKIKSAKLVTAARRARR